jgi:hypothetical protein
LPIISRQKRDRLLYLDDDAQKIGGDVSCSLGKEHLQDHHPETMVQECLSDLLPFEMS